MSVSVLNVTKKYGNQFAIKKVSFEVQSGEIVGFLGPNGAGKSTTMKIISCYFLPNSGQVELNGYNIYEHSYEVRRRIGYLAEHNPLYLDMSVVDYLRLAASLQYVNSKIVGKRIQKMIDICNLAPEMHKNIGELSKGYRQRVGLAQALIHDPDVLILDEPTTGLDPNQIIEIRSLIKEIGREKTIILSSHILKEVEATCGRIIIINKGEIVTDKRTEDLIKTAGGRYAYKVSIESEKDSPLIVKQKLLSLEGAQNVTYSDIRGGEWVVSTYKESDIAARIFHLCVDRQWVLTQMMPMESSLEDVFRQLTS